MKKIILFCLLFFFYSFLNSQTTFDYDASGNRISRVIVLPSQPARVQQNPQQNGEDEQDSSAHISDESVESALDSENPPKIYTDKLNESDVLIYPNPTQGMLAVEIRNKNLETPHQLTVLNLNGKVIFQQNYSGTYTEINLSSQPKGTYLLRISSQETLITWKIIKE